MISHCQHVRSFCQNLTKRSCCYLTFTQAKGGSQADLTCLQFINFWLESISTHCVLPEELQDHQTEQLSPPIFIVGTHRASQSQPTDKVLSVDNFSYGSQKWTEI